MNTHTSRNTAGFALVIALILLIVITLIGLSAARFTSIESRLASNDQVHVETLENVQSMLDATLDQPNNTLILGSANTRNCTSTPGLSGCDYQTVTLTGGLFGSDISAGNASAVVTLITPNSSVPRGLGYSVDCFSAASFDVSATIDRTSQGRGRSTTNQGVKIIYSNGGC